MRIYQVDDYHHIDLAKIVSIRQYMNRVAPKKGRNEQPRYDCWIEVTIDSGRTIAIDCRDVEKLIETYELLLKAWKHFVGDEEEIFYGVGSGFSPSANSNPTQTHAAHIESY